MSEAGTRIGKVTPLAATGMPGDVVDRLVKAGIVTAGDLVNAWPSRKGELDLSRRAVAAIETIVREVAEDLTATIWTFPTRQRCPKCGSSHTHAVKTENGYQYRRCQVAYCDFARRSFVTRGTRL